jgi:hypothetical protein
VRKHSPHSHFQKNLQVSATECVFALVYRQNLLRMKSTFNRWLTAALFISAAGLSAQNNQFSIRLGAGRIDRQDQVFSPFVQSGVSVQQLGLHWQRSAGCEQFAGLRYSGFSASRLRAFDYTKKPDTEIKTTLPHTFTFVEIDYGIGKKWQAGGYSISAGGALDNAVQALNYQYGEASFFGYFATFSLSPWLHLSRPVGRKSSLHAGLRIPVLSWVARSPYLVNDDEFIENTSSHSGFKTFADFVQDGSLQFPDQLQKLSGSLGYTQLLGRRWTAGLQYGFQFIRHTEPLTLLSYQQDLRVEIGWKF